jgi:hypothetical protein
MTGRTNRLSLLHEYPPEVRFVFKKGEAVYNGYPINHNKTEQVMAWWTDIINVEYAEAIPTLWVRETGGDFELQADADRLRRLGITKEDLIQVGVSRIDMMPNATVPELLANIKISDITKAKLQRVEVENIRDKWHSEAIREKGLTHSLKQELEGFFSRNWDLQGLAMQYQMNICNMRLDLFDALEEMLGDRRIRIQWWMIVGVLLAIGMVTVALRPELVTRIYDLIATPMGLVGVVGSIVLISIVVYVANKYVQGRRRYR